jgi:long-chain acyl-CoA synthetase
MKNLGLTLDSRSDQDALVDLSDPDQPRTYSFSRLSRLADGVAAGLAIDPGTHIGILAQNSAGFIAILLGIMRAGGVAVPINFKFPDATIDYIVEDAGLQTIFADEQNQARLASNLTVHSMAGIEADTFASITPSPGEPALVLYTSGSTGRPKGVVLSHDSQWSMVDRPRSHMAGLCGIVAAPLYHMNGMLYSFMLLQDRGKAVLLPRFSARTYLQALSTYKVNILTGVPTMLSMMAREKDLVESLDFSSVVSIFIGSAPLSDTVARETEAIFPNARITNGYGTTEAGAGMFGPHPDGIPTPAVSLGYPQAHVALRLVGNESGTEGVLEVKTAAAMNGYLNLPEKTASKLSSDGWINTGDIMRIDENGFYYFVGRDDDMFNCGGENIYPGEMERLLEKDPRISECSVVPLSDPVRGHIPVAFIVRASEHEIDEQAVKDTALAGAPAYMHPRHVHFIDEMPLAGTNKIDRRLLQERAKSPGNRT